MDSVISRQPGRGHRPTKPLSCQRHHRSLIVELVASSPGHTTGDHRRRHGTHASAPFSQRKLIQLINKAGGQAIITDASAAKIKVRNRKTPRKGIWPPRQTGWLLPCRQGARDSQHARLTFPRWKPTKTLFPVTRIGRGAMSGPFLISASWFQLINDAGGKLS